MTIDTAVGVFGRDEFCGKAFRRFTHDRDWTTLSRLAGQTCNSLSDCVNKGWVPKFGKAIAVAKALDVSLDWLADDDQEWSPVPKSPKGDIRSAPKKDLIDEFLRRFRRKAK